MSRVLMHLSKASGCSETWFTHIPDHSVSAEDTVPNSGGSELDWIDIDDVDSSDPSGPMDDTTPPPTSTGAYYSEAFPAAGATYGRGKTFMHTFDADQFSSQRQTNLFYPFASESEWQTASFLLRSGMSTRAIDEFFTLPLVSYKL